MKRIVTIQDLSCFGKCSLTVALPVISAMGIETAVLPTAVLSNHTSGFEDYTFHDLSDEIVKITDSWENKKIKFDAVYTGYLGSEKQIEITEVFFEKQSPGTLIFVDPAMADNGEMYSGLKKSYADKMAALIKKADIIAPNITEACIMLGKEYKESGYDKEYIEDILKGLSDLGAKKIILTGVSFETDKMGAAVYDGAEKNVFYYFNDRIDAKFHGTGDVFSSACIGAVIRGKTLEESVKIAVDYTLECIKMTLPEKEEHWYSVQFERALPYLIKRM